MKKLFLLTLTLVCFNVSASALKFFVDEETRKGRVGDKPYTLKVKIAEQTQSFERFELTIAGKTIPISDKAFYQIKDIEFDTLELMIGRDTQATSKELLFGPYENLSIQFLYSGDIEDQCSVYLAIYQIKLSENTGTLTRSCSNED